MPDKNGPKERPLKRPEDYYIKLLLSQVRMKDIMTRDVFFVWVDTPFSEVAKKLLDSRIRHLPVLDRSHKVVGLITQRDLFRTQSPVHREDGTWYYDDQALNSVILGRVMKSDPFTMRPEEPVGDAVVRMVTSKYGCIPIVDDNHALCGIVTQLDILKLAARIYSE